MRVCATNGAKKAKQKQSNAFNCLAFMVLGLNKPAEAEHLWDNQRPFNPTGQLK